MKREYGLPYSNIYVTIPPLTGKLLEREGWRGSAGVVEVNLVAGVKYLARLRRALPGGGPGPGDFLFARPKRKLGSL